MVLLKLPEHDQVLFFLISQTAPQTIAKANRVPMLTILEIESMGVNAATTETAQACQ